MMNHTRFGNWKLGAKLLRNLVLACTATCLSQSVWADTSSTVIPSLSATVRPAGPRAASNFFNVEGSSYGVNASFGVLDFSIASFGVATSVTQVNSLTLNLIESNAAFTVAGGLNFYISTDTSTSVVLGASTPNYDATAGPEGIGTQFSPNYLIGTGLFNTTGNVNSDQVDTYTFTLGGVGQTAAQASAQSYLLSLLQAGTGNLRLLVTASQATTAATWGSNTSAARKPTSLLDVTFASSPNYTWIGGTGNWNPAATPGDVNWNNGSTFGPWDSTKTAIFNGTAGTVSLTGAVTAAGLQFDSDGYTIAGAGNVLTLSATNVRVAVTNLTDTATINAPIAGTSGLIKTGLGKLILGGTNTYTGTTAIQGGTLSVAADANLGAAANGIDLSGGTLQTTTAGFATSRALSGSGGTLDANSSASFSGNVGLTGQLTLLNAGTVTFSGATKAIGGFRFQQGGTTVVNSGSALALSGTTFSNNTTGTATIQGNIDLGSAAATFNTTEGSADVDLQINGNISSATGRLTKSGLGTLELVGDNSGLGGGASIGAGRLLIHDGNALGTAAQLFFNGGTLETQNTSGTTSFESGISFGAGALATPNTATFQGTNTVFGGTVGFFKNGGAAQAAYQHSITLNNTKVTLSGPVASEATNSTGLTVKGTGTLEFSGAAGSSNNFASGQSIIVESGATVLANKEFAFGLARGIIGGRLGGTGTVQDLTLLSGGTIAPGNSPGTLSANSLLWNGGGTLEFELGTASDLLALTGDLTKGDAGLYNFSFSDSGGLTLGETYQLVTFGSTTFSATDFTASGLTGVFTVGVDNVSFTVVAVPEPQTYLLAGLSLVGFYMIRRRRQRA